MLRLANPDLSADQMTVLTSCQFMRGLPQDLQIKLLENDPVPTLDKIVSFTQNMRAIDRTTVSGPDVAAASSPESLEIAKLTAIVEQLATSQQELRAALSRTQHSANRRQPTGPCYSCGRRGHLARECRSGNRFAKCFTCNQPGHLARDRTVDLNSNRAVQPGP